MIGDEVRYNGQAAEDRFVNRELSNFVDFVKVCPEVGIGLGIPRETIRLVKKEEGIRLVNHGGDKDFTDAMNSFSKESADKMHLAGISGFIFKKSSPSCGAFRIKVYNEKGVTQHESSIGMYSKHIQERFPWLPVEEDGRLNDAALRHNFIARIFAMKRWQENVEPKPSIKALVDFHQTHKYMLMSYCQNGLRELGQLVANTEGTDISKLTQEYLLKFAELSKKPAPQSKHVNVLYHLIGYFTQELDDFDKKEMVENVEKYRKGLIPLVVPISRIRHYVKKYDVEYLNNQAYLDYPEELCVLNKL
jgi:uncharacterized protein YbgA (DUF1722 family)/uncharacterized protein YbbK (DUF523 family)